MRFDLADLQLFIAVARPAASPTVRQVHLALARQRGDQGLEEALGVSLLTRGRRGVERPAGEACSIMQGS
jgi:DNA-binding transcriptional LysR family regulator